MTVGDSKVSQFKRGRNLHRCTSNRGSSSHGPTSGDEYGRVHYNSRGGAGFSHRRSNRGGFSQHSARILAITVVVPPHISLPVLLKENGADRARNLAFRSSL